MTSFGNVLACGLAGLVGLGAAGAAAAGEGTELRVGLTAHNIQVIDGKNAGKEDGPNASFEAVFASPEMLSWAFAPRPYITVSANTAGATSFAGVGLEWKVPLGAGWSIEPGMGYVVHDGEVKNPYPNGDPRAARFSNEHVLLGSRDLFRTSVGLSAEIGGPWSAQVIYEHLSHGQILGNGRNQGLDTLGLRVAYRFDGG
jgi:lipid A 3-O-deacylase